MADCMSCSKKGAIDFEVLLSILYFEFRYFRTGMFTSFDDRNPLTKLNEDFFLLFRNSDIYSKYGILNKYGF